MIINIVCLNFVIEGKTTMKNTMKKQKKQAPFSMATGNEELMHDVLPNTLAWEQQE